MMAVLGKMIADWSKILCYGSDSESLLSSPYATSDRDFWLTIADWGRVAFITVEVLLA